MRIVYFGSGEFGLPTLQALHAKHHVALVVSQPDRPAGRNRALTPTPIALWAAENNLPLIKPEKVNAPEALGRVLAAKPDANIVIAFGQKIGPALIESPRFGQIATMNLHASLLPKYRGAAPIHRAILGGEAVTGNTIFALVDRMDAGEILGTRETPVNRLETTGELHDRLAAMGPELVLDVLAKLEGGTLTPLAQDESRATLAPKLGRADGVVDFTQPADLIRQRVHALTPWPGVTVHYAVEDEGARQPIMLRRMEVVEGRRQAEPGRVIGDGVVMTGEGAVKLLEVQPPGKRTMTWEEFARGLKSPIARFYSTGG
jgi:methionyl-tRNA formyltransferase